MWRLSRISKPRALASPSNSEALRNASSRSHKTLRIVANKFPISCKYFYAKGALLWYIMGYLFNLLGITGKNMRHEKISYKYVGSERGLYLHCSVKLLVVLLHLFSHPFIRSRNDCVYYAEVGRCARSVGDTQVMGFVVGSVPSGSPQTAMGDRKK